MLNDFTQLEAWKKAMDLAQKIHALTGKFPQEERYALVSQMRRAALSVVANIAEGFGRFTPADKKHKYIQSRGELIELMTFLHYSRRVLYIESDPVLTEFLDECNHVHKLVNGLINAMRKSL